jgi:hypothetical protein
VCLAPRLWDRQSVDPELLHLLDLGLGIGVGVIEFPCDRAHLAVYEVPDDLDDRGLVVGEILHVGPFRFRSVC